MSRTLDASLDDPGPAEIDARRTLRERREAVREAADKRHKADLAERLAATLRDQADELDPQPRPFSRIRIGDVVLIEDQWFEVTRKETRTDEDEQVQRLVVREPGRFSTSKVTIEPDERLAVQVAAF